MFLESRTVRAWLSTPAAETSGRSLNAIPPPPSAAFSFNPFPALCIGVTGKRRIVRGRQDDDDDC
jgi:hypothetical protein